MPAFLRARITFMVWNMVSGNVAAAAAITKEYLKDKGSVPLKTHSSTRGKRYCSPFRNDNGRHVELVESFV
jgi:hypothetical protein